MKTIKFTNKSVIKEGDIVVMGNSNKSDEHIGRFGTGLKYVIAYCVRNSVYLDIKTPDYCYTFHKYNKYNKFVIRVEIAKRNGDIYDNYNSVTLLISQDLGKFWEHWFILRELVSNCRDEDGQMSINEHYNQDTIVEEGTEVNIELTTTFDTVLLS